jgi:hypothetical protein
MILGISLEHFALLHVVISLVGIVSGLVVAYGLLNGARLDQWTAVFISTTMLTSLTGYLFPFHELLPSHIVGGISILVLFLAIAARYGRNLAGAWRRTYVVTAMCALYLNVFVLVVQGFRQVAALKALAPTATETPFKLVHLVVLAAFVFLAVLADKRFRSTTKGLDTVAAYIVVPPKAEYKLTRLGFSLGSAFCGVWMWAEENLDQVAIARTAFDERAKLAAK